MGMMYFIVTILWVIAGAIVLGSPEVTKFEYGVCWIALIANLLSNCLTK